MSESEPVVIQPRPRIRTPLTPLQDQVWELSKQGLKPSEIAARTRLSIGRVGNIRTRLDHLGYEIPMFRQYRGADKHCACICHGDVSEYIKTRIDQALAERDRWHREELAKLTKAHLKELELARKAQDWKRCRCGLRLVQGETECGACTPRSASWLAMASSDYSIQGSGA